MSQQPAAGRGSLATMAIRGVAWTLPTSLASRAIGLVGTLLVARYLAPAEFGEVSAAAILTITASSITTLGVGIYLVNNRDISRAEVFHATCWFLAVGVAIVGATWALSGPLGRWSGAPGVGRFMPVFVLSVLLDRISYVPERMLVRRLRFGWLSMARASAELVYTGVSLGMAALGFGAMAIAWGNLARSALRVVAILPSVGWREWLEPHRLRLATMGRIVAYGLNVSAATIAGFAMRRLDNLLVGRFFGSEVMGAYNYAYNLADTPAVAVGEQMSDVISASFPHLALERRGSALVRSCALTSLVMFPLAFGLGAVAPTVVDTFFGQRWPGLGPMLLILSVLSATRPMAHVVHSYLYSCHRPGIVLWLEWVSFAAIVVALSTVGRYDIRVACGAVGAVFVLRTLASIWTVRRLDGIPLSRFLGPLLRPLAVCLVMAATIALVRGRLPGVEPAVRLVVEISLGAVVYLGGTLLVSRAAVRELRDLLRAALSPSREPETIPAPPPGASGEGDPGASAGSTPPPSLSL